MPGSTPLLAVRSTLRVFGLSVGAAAAVAGISRALIDDAVLQQSFVATFCVFSGAFAFATGRYVLTLVLGALGLISVFGAL